MDNNEARKLYFSKIDSASSDGELVASLCSECRGLGCNVCHNTGKVPFKFEVESEWYSIPLHIFPTKEGVHELLKAICPEFPVNEETGKPKSLGNSRNSASEEEIYKMLDWMYQRGLESGIDLANWTAQRSNI